MGRRALAVRCDVTERAEVDAAVARAVEELGSVDILVNNAGTLDHAAQFQKQSPELWERDLRVNLTGAFNCAQAVWPHMRERPVAFGRLAGIGLDLDVRDHDVGAGAGKRQRIGATEPARTTGDECDPTREVDRDHADRRCRLSAPSSGCPAPPGIRPN